MGGVSIATCEVNTHSEVDLTSSHDVVQEGVYTSGLGREGPGEGGREGGNKEVEKEGIKGRLHRKCFANVERPLDNEARE